MFTDTFRGMGRAGRGVSSRRTGRVGVVALLLVVALGSFVFAAAPAQSDGVVRGSAEASADTFSVSIKAANATIGFAYGRSFARYQDRTGSSEARALDLGALPTLFGGPQCDGSPSLLTPEALPPITSADSSLAGSDRSRRTQVFLPGIGGEPNGGPVGFQDATATPLPASTARTESVPADVFLVALVGGRTETSASLVNGVREARSVVTADELRVLGGLFTLRSPRWEATARSGAQESTSSTFTFASASVLGIERPVTQVMSDLHGFKAELERLLAPFGVELQLPSTQLVDGGVRVTPMGLRVAEPPIGTDVLMPFLGQIDPLVQALRQQLVAADCKNEVALTVVDVLLGVLGGSGSIELLAGGVEAVTTDTDFTVPPPLPGPPDPPTEVAAATTIAPDLFTSEFSSPVDTGVGTSFDLGVGELGLGDPGVGAAQVAARTRERTAEEAAPLPSLVGSRFEDGDAGRAAVAVGTVALVGALALAFGDRLLSRRAGRTIR